MNLDTVKIHKKLKSAIKKFYLECGDYYPDDERVIQFRIGYYMQKSLEALRQEDVFVDSEYYKHIDNQKIAFQECKLCKESNCVIKTDKKEYEFEIKDTETEPPPAGSRWVRAGG